MPSSYILSFFFAALLVCRLACKVESTWWRRKGFQFASGTYCWLQYFEYLWRNMPCACLRLCVRGVVMAACWGRSWSHLHKNSHFLESSVKAKMDGESCTGENEPHYIRPRKRTRLNGVRLQFVFHVKIVELAGNLGLSNPSSSSSKHIVFSPWNPSRFDSSLIWTTSHWSFDFILANTVQFSSCQYSWTAIYVHLYLGTFDLRTFFFNLLLFIRTEIGYTYFT
jgi:hypothetical protein